MQSAIDEVSDFCFHTLSWEATLIDLKMDRTHFKGMAEHVCVGGRITGSMELWLADVEKIYKMCLQKNRQRRFLQ